MIKFNLQRLPAPLLIVLLAFAILPLWSLTFVVPPWEAFANGDPLTGILVLLAYFALPVLIVTALLMGSISFLPLFICECLGLIFHLIKNFDTHSSELQAMRLALFGIMAIAGVFVLNRDTLYPFLSKSQRFWRKAQRISTNVKWHLVENGKKLPVMMQDISLSGMGFVGPSSHLLSVLKTKKKGDQLILCTKLNGEVMTVMVDLCWSTEHGETRQFGVSISDTALMEKVIAQLSLNTGQGRFSQFVVKNWAKLGFRRAMLTIWGLALTGTLGVPACGSLTETSHSSSRSTSGQFAVRDDTATRDYREENGENPIAQDANKSEKDENLAQDADIQTNVPKKLPPEETTLPLLSPCACDDLKCWSDRSDTAAMNNVMCAIESALEIAHLKKFIKPEWLKCGITLGLFTPSVVLELQACQEQGANLWQGINTFATCLKLHVSALAALEKCVKGLGVPDLGPAGTIIGCAASISDGIYVAQANARCLWQDILVLGESSVSINDRIIGLGGCYDNGVRQANVANDSDWRCTHPHPLCLLTGCQQCMKTLCHGFCDTLSSSPGAEDECIGQCRVGCNTYSWNASGAFTLPDAIVPVPEHEPGCGDGVVRYPEVCENVHGHRGCRADCLGCEDGFNLTGTLCFEGPCPSGQVSYPVPDGHGFRCVEECDLSAGYSFNSGTQTCEYDPCLVEDCSTPEAPQCPEGYAPILGDGGDWICRYDPCLLGNCDSTPDPDLMPAP